jgi:hypothetical protein
MKTVFGMAPNKAATFSSAPPADLRGIERSVGFLRRMQVNTEVGREAAKALADVKIETHLADARVAKAAIAIKEAIVTSALVTDGMATIGLLTLDLNAKTGAVQTNLTAAAGAERITHVMTRGATLQAIESRRLDGRVSDAEARALNSYADADLSEDVERTNQRIRRSKDAVEVLHDFALGGLQRATAVFK